MKSKRLQWNRLCLGILGASALSFIAGCATESAIGINSCALQLGMYNNPADTEVTQTVVRLTPVFWNDAATVNGVELGLLKSASAKINGVALDLGISSTRTVNGVQAGLLFNTTDTMNGVQFSAINSAENANGVQMALYNHVGATGTTFQLGLFNEAHNAEVFQLGLLNHNGHFWFPIINMNTHNLRADAHPDRKAADAERRALEAKAKAEEAAASTPVEEVTPAEDTTPGVELPATEPAVVPNSDEALDTEIKAELEEERRADEAAEDDAFTPDANTMDPTKKADVELPEVEEDDNFDF